MQTSRTAVFFQNSNVVRRERSSVSNIMHAPGRIISARRGRHRCLRGNWPKLENKRNSASRNIEDAREGNNTHGLYEEIFAVRIMLLSMCQAGSPTSNLKNILFMRWHIHTHTIVVLNKRLYHSVPLAIFFISLSISLSLSRKSYRVGKRNSERNSLMAEIFAIFVILL